MAAVNSLLLILSTLALYTHGFENSAVTYPSAELDAVNSYSRHGAHSEIFPHQKCPSPFEWYTCTSHCPRTCERPMMRPCVGCIPGCDCVPPLVRGPYGDCIFHWQCPNAGIEQWKLKMMESEEGCEPEEEKSCYSHCEKNCTNYDQNIDCPIYCVEGCVCKEPKIRGPDGNCILPQYCPSSQHLQRVKQYDENEHSNSLPEILDQFPSCSGENEVWSLCPSQCPDDCYNYENETRACKILCSLPKCECRRGFVRGPSGDCIKPEQCPKPENPQIKYLGEHLQSENTCPENEVYKRCGSACPKNCNDYDKEVACPSECVSGCFCKDPMVRGPDGNCVHKEDCPIQPLGRREHFLTCSGENEVWSICPPQCPDDCYNYENERRACKILCSLPKCECKPGFVRGPSGHCIKPEQCPKPENPQIKYLGEHMQSEITCPENEVYKRCGSACPKNCNDYDKEVACPSVCVSGCFCKDPMVRGPDGNCVHIEDCPIQPLGRRDHTCPENEYYNDCLIECMDMDDIYPCYCVPGCYCKRSMKRGSDGKCRYKESFELSPLQQTLLREFLCPADEVYLFCGSPCEKDCSNFDINVPCVEMCSQGCFCEEPKVRGPERKCISREECPSSSNGTQLDSGTFLQPANACPENEEYKKCGTACQKNCANYDEEIVCPSECVSGCFCKDPMIRGPDGSCINKEECPRHSWARKGLKTPQRQGFFPHFPTLKCQENEEFSICASVCPDNCNNYQTDRLCKHICMPGCKCKDGYVLGNEGICIKMEECREPKPADCTDLEYFDDCGIPCETDCYNYLNSNGTCEIKGCKKGCFCKPGWVRSADWKCVLPESCPK